MKRISASSGIKNTSFSNCNNDMRVGNDDLQENELLREMKEMRRDMLELKQMIVELKSWSQLLIVWPFVLLVNGKYNQGVSVAWIWGRGFKPLVPLYNMPRQLHVYIQYSGFDCDLEWAYSWRNSSWVENFDRDPFQSILQQMVGSTRTQYQSKDCQTSASVKWGKADWGIRGNIEFENSTIKDPMPIIQTSD